MAKTIVGLYDDRATAIRVAKDLENAGFGEDHLRMTSHEKGDRTAYDFDVTEAKPAYFTRYGIPEDEASFYAEGVRRGGAIVVARTHDSDAERAADIMAGHNPTRYEDRSAAYAKETDYSGYDENAALYTEAEAKQERERFADERAERMKEIEEHMKIGKREVVRGGVRLHRYVDTDVEEETLRLREEHVNVDRKAVNRPATAADLADAFEEKTVEMVERSEEAVVEKEAVVTGEVALGKEVNTREETVGGEVRRVRVEVEQIADETFGREADQFRTHYDKAYATTDYDYDYYEPAYRYGYAAAGTYGDRKYDALEGDLRRDYEGRYGDDSAWDDVKDAVRHGWNRAKAAVS
jgi:stress response protein YsnF